MVNIFLILYSFSHQILKDSIYEKYFLDGTSEKYEEIYIKIEDEKGTWEWNQISIYYTPYYNNSEFKFVEIKRKDEIIKIPLENIKDELAPPELGGTIFWGTRKKTLQLPKLNIGDVIHYGVFYKGGNWLGPSGEIIYRTPFPGYFNTIEIFEDYVPIKRKIYVIEELKEKPIKFKIFNGKINYKRKKINGKIVHIFWCDSIPPAKREYFSGSKYNNFRKLIITNIPSWIDISKHEYFLSEESIEPHDYIKNFTDSILKDAKSDSEKIYKLFYFVSDKIRYLGLVETDVEGYKPHKAEIVLKHMEGVCKDKAGLLVSLLRAAGFKAYYAITGVGIRIEDFPSDQANHALVALEQKPFKYIYLDPTIGSGGKNLLPAYEEGQEVLVARKEGDILRKIPFSKTEEKRINIFIEENIFKNEIKGKLKINTKKGFDQFFREIFRDKEYKDLKRFFKNYFHFLKNFEIDTILFMDTYDYSKYFEFEINFKREPEFLKIEKYILFKPILFYKEFIGNFLWEINFIEKERKYPFVFNFNKKIEIIEKINSEDFEIVAFPKKEKFKGKKANFEIEGEKDKIILSISIDKKEYKGKEYEEIYKLRNEIKRSFKKWIILKG